MKRIYVLYQNSLNSNTSFAWNLFTIYSFNVDQCLTKHPAAVKEHRLEYESNWLYKYFTNYNRKS